ncbi:MAG: hypothetical protein AABX14_04325 [Candidatus Aenigmatarchaeota archaeon]
MKKLFDALKYHFIDSTAIITVTNPMYTALEMGPAGMSSETSMHARILGSVLTYVGFGSIYAQGRDLSKRMFGITESASERVKILHDTLYNFVYLSALQPPFYYAAGSRNIKEIAIGTAGSALMGLFSGPVAGYAVDSFRDFTGLKESERLPNFIKNQSPKTKKYAAALLTAASVGALATVYSLTR